MLRAQEATLPGLSMKLRTFLACMRGGTDFPLSNSPPWIIPRSGIMRWGWVMRGGGVFPLSYKWVGTTLRCLHLRVVPTNDISIVILLLIMMMGVELVPRRLSLIIIILLLILGVGATRVQGWWSLLLSPIIVLWSIIPHESGVQLVGLLLSCWIIDHMHLQVVINITSKMDYELAHDSCCRWYGEHDYWY